MIQKRAAPLVFLGLAVLCLLSCPNDTPAGAGEPSGDVLEIGPITAVEGAGPVYFSLSTGRGITGESIVSQEWDIAFEYSRMIYTNSGDTAAGLGSGGEGGVWASGTADFNAVQSMDNADFSLPFAVDTARYTSPAAEMGAPVLNRLNVISYVGYGKGSGATAEDPLTDYKYNAKQYYNADLSTMPPVYSLTRQVYIIRHGNGGDYSKVQITALDTVASTKGNRRIFSLTYQNF
ncbi:MAG: HmuY family protein [Treponema sp.]|jgi:hypothetical protein|nr:HmuY family protein [Treponema sp.]